MEKLQNQLVDQTKENGVVTTEIYDAFCRKCMKPYNPNAFCDICNNNPGKELNELFTDPVDTAQVTALHCKYGCNSLASCKGRCNKQN